MGDTEGDYYMQSSTVLQDAVFSLTSRTKAKPRQNQHKQTSKKTKTLLNSVTAVKQSNHQQEFGCARRAILLLISVPLHPTWPRLRMASRDLNFMVVVSLSHNLNAI